MVEVFGRQLHQQLDQLEAKPGACCQGRPPAAQQQKPDSDFLGAGAEDEVPHSDCSGSDRRALGRRGHQTFSNGPSLSRLDAPSSQEGEPPATPRTSPGDVIPAPCEALLPELVLKLRRGEVSRRATLTNPHWTPLELL